MSTGPSGVGGEGENEEGKWGSTIETEDKTTGDFLFGGWKGSHG